MKLLERKIYPRDPLLIAEDLGISDKKAIRRLRHLFETNAIKGTSTVCRLSPKANSSGKHPRQKIRFYVDADFPDDLMLVRYQYYDPAIGVCRWATKEVEVGFYKDVSIEPRDGTDIVYNFIRTLKEAPTTIEIAEQLDIPKRRIASVLQTLVRSGRIKQYRHLNSDGKPQKLLNGHLYYTHLKQVTRRLKKPESLLGGQMGKVGGEIADRNRRGFFCLEGDLEQILNLPRHLLMAHLRRIFGLSLGLQKISVEGRTCYYFENILDEEKIKSAKEAAIASDISETDGLLTLHDDSGDTEGLLERSAQFGRSLIEELNSRPVGSRIWFSKLARIVRMGYPMNFSSNSSNPKESSRKLDFDGLKRILGKDHDISITHRHVSLFLIHFNAQLYGYTIKKFLVEMERNEGYRRVCFLGNASIPHPSTVSVFKNRFEGNMNPAYEFMRDYILSKIDVDNLTSNDYKEMLERFKVELFNRIQRRFQTTKGLDIFIEYLNRIGLVSEIMGAYTDEKRPNGLDVEKLIRPMLLMNVIDARNFTALATKLKFKDDQDLLNRTEFKIPASKNTFQDALKRLDPELLREALFRINSEFLVLMGVDRLDVAMDITEIPVYSDNYEDAYWDYVPDHGFDASNPKFKSGKKKKRKKKGKIIKAMFIIVAYEIKTRLPLQMIILEKEQYHSPDIILQMIKSIENKYGKGLIRTVLYDRGFYKYEMFGKINKRLIGFITPNVNKGELGRIIKETPKEKFKRIKRMESNEFIRVYETFVTLSGYEGKVRFIVIEDTVKQKKNGKLRKKKRRYGYLTNIVDLPLKRIIRMYDKRWLIENYFKELKNAKWNFKNFPSTDRKRVRNHFTMGMINFSTLSFLKHLWNRATWELDRLVLEFIRFCMDFVSTNSGYEFVPSINVKSNEIEYEQSMATYEDLNIFDPIESDPVGVAMA